MYIFAALLSNLKTCLGHIGQMGTFVEFQAPSLAEYFSYANPDPQDGNHME